MMELRLGADEHALIGYGSLLSIESMQRTLGEQYTGPFHLVRLHGWQRGWDVQMPNTRWRYRDGQRIVTPEHVVYLNVRRAADRHINAALFVVTRDALAMFDQREWIYDRVDVTGAIENVTIVGGTAWMYVARPEHMSSAPPPPPKSIIRRSYLDILASAHITLGDDFRREYEATTDAVRPELVVDDIDV